MSNINTDPYCNSPLLDSSLFPVGTANFLDRNYNVLPYLCQLLQVANDETVNPVLAEPPEFDITPFTDFSGLATVGDPRVSLGVTLSATLIYFLPRMISQTELLQSGGSQIIDNFICDQDGNPIKESITIPALLSSNLSANNAYKYGALEIPPITLSLEELLKPITTEEIQAFVTNYINGSRANNSEYFLRFLNTWFLYDERWKPSLHMYLNGGFLFVKLEYYNSLNDSDYYKSLYLKYYEDQKDVIGCALNLEDIIYHTGNYFGNTSLSKAVGSPVFDYREILSKPLAEQQQFYNIIINNFTTLKSEEVNLQNLFNPKLSIGQSSTIYANLTSQYFQNPFDTNVETLSSVPIDKTQCSINNQIL